LGGRCAIASNGDQQEGISLADAISCPGGITLYIFGGRAPLHLQAGAQRYSDPAGHWPSKGLAAARSAR